MTYSFPQGAARKVEAELTAQNTYTPAISVFGAFNFSASGTWAGTITIQRSFDSGASWRDVERYVANEEDRGLEPELNALYRAGFKPGEYTSGTAVVRLSQ